MEPKEQQIKQKKKLLRDWFFFGITIVVAVVLLLFFPAKTDAVVSTAQEYFIEMMIVLPAVMIIMGLFAVFISDETVVKYLGKTSGIKGIALAIILGALPTGPLYVAFPLAATLVKKGARISNIIVFLSAWACIKLPQELVELQFLGVDFMVSRLILTIIFVIFMGYIIERIVEWNEKGLTINRIENENGE
ncbi:MAG: permease [Candidatus Thermoplasmatota archaeon]|nr:permease [Candidatus Thermoplasmatota archaeon]